MSGWCRLYRKSEDSEAFQDSDLWKVWTWCLMKAFHKRAKLRMKAGRGTREIEIERGQFVTGRHAASKALCMPATSVVDRFRKLERLGNITVFSDTNFTIITVCNYGSYNPAKKPCRQRSVNDPSQTRNTTLDLIGNSPSLSYSLPEGGVNDGSQEARGGSRLLIPVPASLNTPEFVTAWESWKGHLWALTNGRLSFATLGEHLLKFDGWGPSKSVLAIRYTISKANWKDPALPPEQAQQAVAAAMKPRAMTPAERVAEELAAQEEHERKRSVAR